MHSVLPFAATSVALAELKSSFQTFGSFIREVDVEALFASISAEHGRVVSRSEWKIHLDAHLAAGSTPCPACARAMLDFLPLLARFYLRRAFARALHQRLQFAQLRPHLCHCLRNKLSVFFR